MKHMKIFGTLAEMQEFLATNPTFGVLAMNSETGSFAAISSAAEEQISSPYVAVDLGLASGTKWANMNVGAESEEQAGLYFAWGDTEGFKASEVSGDMFSDSWYSSRPGVSLTSDITPDGGHDAARVNMGGTWRMPTKAEMEELVDYGNRTWTTVGGVNGYKIVNSSDSSKYIFLSAAGGGDGGSVYYVGDYGFYWSSSFFDSDDSYGLNFNSGGFHVGYSDRYYGFSVRGVQD